MIKIYLDWNIMSSMRRGSFIELESLLRNNEKFLVIYSTSHIGDILVSHSEDEKQKEIINDDLNYITSITDNNCFFNDGKNIQLGFMDPIKMYNNRVDSQDLFKDLSIDNLFAAFDGDEVLSPLINSLKNLLKIAPLGDSLKNIESKNEINKVLPNLPENLSFEKWFKYFGNFYNRLNETEDYKSLRESVQENVVSSDHFNKDKDPYEIINNAYKKLGIDRIKPNTYFDNSKNAPEWFNEIVDDYLMLDMHGYKQDEIKVNDKKKKTFKNTTEDSFHTAFASRCDFYITNDKKNIAKAKTIYSKLEINTCIYTPEEFIQYYNEYLDIHGFTGHYSNLVDVLETGKNYYGYTNETDENGNPICFLGFSNHYFFNFFNKVRICKSITDSSPYYLISRNYPSRIYYTTLKEIENIVAILINALGNDDLGKGYYVAGEIETDEWLGRVWTLESMQINLKRINGHFQLYFYPNSTKKNIFLSFFKHIKLLLNRF